MPFNTVTVATAVTPTVIETCLSHYLRRKPLKHKPTAHISYHEGLCLVRQFLHYASLHRVEDIQSFTSQWVPHPYWVKVDEVTIPQDQITAAAEALVTQLGPRGIERVGGTKWWQWRMEGTKLDAEWIEMRADYTARQAKEDKGRRVMLYVHGGAYFFGSVDEHRYQLQRHARKLQARVFARLNTGRASLVFMLIATARYRLAPQFPFPCGLHDCLSAYLYLLSVHDPSEILLAGDSAGGGMVLSMLVILRDQGLLLPAGAILISPWVDLTHSFPSVAGDSSLDYIPPHGFMQRPSAAWPPPNQDDLEAIERARDKEIRTSSTVNPSIHDQSKEEARSAAQGFSVSQTLESGHADSETIPQAGSPSRVPQTAIPGPSSNLSITLGDEVIEIKDQIQMYTTNQMLSHPLVSPVLQPSLGGLPPLLIMTGGGELLRDEQIYLAHKAANPAKYPPGDAYLALYPEVQGIITKWEPTHVQLQVWDDLCHVAPTLSFTRPAKYMYRSIAQFGAWALARSQNREIEIPDDAASLSSTGSDTETESSPKIKRHGKQHMASPSRQQAEGKVGKAGDDLPTFRDHMIRQRVDRHGNTYALAPPSALPALRMSADEVGAIKPGPVRKWMHAKQKWDVKFAREKRKVQVRRMEEMLQGYETFGPDERPPPSALAGRRGLRVPQAEKKKRSWGMSLWSVWGSSHDEKAIEREEKTEEKVRPAETDVRSGLAGRDNGIAAHPQSRSRSRRRTVTDAGQTSSNLDKKVDENTTVAELLQLKQGTDNAQDTDYLSPAAALKRGGSADGTGPAVTRVSLGRPTAGGVAFPFKLGTHPSEDGVNASTVTLTGEPGVVAPKGDDDEFVKDARNIGSSSRPEPERFVTASEGLF